jgi:FAD/FMN-containing dehydrogenase
MNPMHLHAEKSPFAADGAAAYRDHTKSREGNSRWMAAESATSAVEATMETLTVAGRQDDLVDVGAAELSSLQRRMDGHIVLPTDPGYDTARRVWNGTVDRYPGLIVYCSGAADVAVAVGFAREHDLRASVRAGGHNVTGNAVCDGGLVIDVSRMKRASVDPESRSVHAEAGLLLGELDTATQAHGLATTMGVNSDTGIAGLTLGGGIGRLARSHGLACDNVLAARIVTADGRLLTASAEENPDLYWAIRGGGGNFGIVTEFTYRLHPVGPTVVGGSLVFNGAGLRDAILNFDEFARTAPDELSADAALVTGPDGRPAFSISVCHAGPVADGLRAVEPLRKLGKPIADGIGPVAYTDLQAAADAMFQRGRRYYWKAQMLPGISATAADELVDCFSRAPSPLSIMPLQQFGGAVTRIPTDATAYPHRSAAFDCFPVAIWEDPAEDEANVRWARETWRAMSVHSTGAVYSNNLGDEGYERIRAAYGENYPRLQRVKARYDPDNFFNGNQNIEPAPDIA